MATSTWTVRGKYEAVAVGLTGQSFRLVGVDTPPATEEAVKVINFLDEVSVDEPTSADGYTRLTLANVAIVEEDEARRALITADDPAGYTGFDNGQVVGFYVARWVSTDANSPVWFWLDTDDMVGNGGNISISLAAGLAYLF